MEFLFEEARSGMFVFKLYNATNLRFIDPSRKQDPYVKLAFGPNYVKESAICIDGDSAPNFQEEELVMWLDEANWTNNLSLYILDKDYREDNPIAMTSFSLLPYVNNRPEQAQRGTYDLYYIEEVEDNGVMMHQERMKGELSMKIIYLPAGKLTVLVGKALGLTFPIEYKHERGMSSGVHERLDAFVELSIEGQAANTLKRTPIDKDGGHDPSWQYEIDFDIVDQYNLLIQVYHQPAVGEDVLLGSAEYPLFQVYRNGHISSWIPLKQRRSLGGISDAGNIFLDFKFNALPGIAYPQYRKNMEAYDDTIRQILPNKEDIPDEDLSDTIIGQASSSSIAKAMEAADRELELKNKPSTMAKADEIAALKISEKNEKQEFSDDEIKQAFDFIDLNHNGFIGASEVRHILTCMGELITDEEIDMMIGMVDLDGDGQVSYLEFRTLVLHPNPESIDLHKEVQKQMEYEVLQDKLSLRGKTTSLDIKSFQRHKELRQRELKKAAIINMIEENDMSFVHVQKAYEMYCLQDPATKVDGRINFDLFCRLLNVDPIYEYHQLHRLFDEEELTTIDFKEFLLSFMNFIPIDREQRVRFSFKMFDEKLTGFIGKREISEILRGNHMISYTSVLRKTETVMKQSLNAASTGITLNEFLGIAKKFPNILFPSLGKQLNVADDEPPATSRRSGDAEEKNRSAKRSSRLELI
jgi:Ca2+-binding EF-hand superfamily protein